MINEQLVTLSLPYGEQKSKTVRVFIPAHERGETFPVVYMTDGQNLFEFDKEHGQYGCWFTREAVRAEREATGKGAVIVGIHNDGSPMERTNELMPESIGTILDAPGIPEELKKQLAPAGEAFEDFVLRTVMPAVEAQFPVKTGRENTAFCGSSMGGLEALYVVLSDPGRFGAGGVFSPALLLYDRTELEQWLRSRAAGELPFVYLYCGGAPGMEEHLMQCTEWTSSILSHCFPPQLLKTDIRPDQPHHETAWASVFSDFLHLFLS